MMRTCILPPLTPRPCPGLHFFAADFDAHDDGRYDDDDDDDDDDDYKMRR